MIDFRAVSGWTRPAFPLATGIVLGATPCAASLALAGAGVAILAAAGTFRPTRLSRDFIALSAAAVLVLPPFVATGDALAGAVPALVAWWLTFALGALVLHAVEDPGKELEVKPREGVGPLRWATPVDPAVRRARLRERRVRWVARVASAGVLALAAGVALGLWGSPGWAGAAAALLLPALVGLALSLPRVHPRYLDRIGWTLVGVEVVTLALLVQGP